MNEWVVILNNKPSYLWSYGCMFYQANTKYYDELYSNNDSYTSYNSKKYKKDNNGVYEYDDNSKNLKQIRLIKNKEGLTYIKIFSVSKSITDINNIDIDELWNYDLDVPLKLDYNIMKENNKEFAEELYAMALHPKFITPRISEYGIVGYYQNR